MGQRNIANNGYREELISHPFSFQAVDFSTCATYMCNNWLLFFKKQVCYLYGIFLYCIDNLTVFWFSSFCFFQAFCLI